MKDIKILTPNIDFNINFRFFHKSPEDPSEVPGGFLTDINEVRMMLLL
jgi:hypothetical protein